MSECEKEAMMKE